MRNIVSTYYLLRIRDIWHIFTHELYSIFHDPGVCIIFFLAGLAYPVIYNLMYWNDNLENIPVAVVDLSASRESRDFLHKWEATPDVSIAYTCTSMDEAQRLMRDQKVHGIIYFPPEYAIDLANMRTAHISLYADMSSFLYMKGVYMSANKVMLGEMRNIEIHRYESMGMAPGIAETLSQAVPYEEVNIFCPTGGYSSFLIPAILVLILHQTLFFGICMRGGVAREENSNLFVIPGRRRSISTLRIIAGRGLAYFCIYMVLSPIVLLVVPRIFHLPHVGNTWDILRFMVPFILSTIFFSMTVSVFVRNRETGMVTLLASSLIFFFISGISWPRCCMPNAWVYLSYCIPSTWGMNGFVHLNSMGATLAISSREYIALWLLTGVYFLTACIAVGVLGKITSSQEPRFPAAACPSK